MARSRLRLGKACNIAKQRGIPPSDVKEGLTRGNTNNEVIIVLKSQDDRIIKYDKIWKKAKLHLLTR